MRGSLLPDEKSVELLDEKRDAIRRVLSAGGAADIDMDKALAEIQDLLARYTRALVRASSEVPRTVRRDEAKAILKAVETLRTVVKNSSPQTRDRFYLQLGELSSQDRWEVGRYLYQSAMRSLRGRGTSKLRPHTVGRGTRSEAR